MLCAKMIVVIDGIDGSGKRIQSRRLVKGLKEKGKMITFTRVPSRHVDGNSLLNGAIFLKDLINTRKLITLAKNRNENFLIIERYTLSAAYAPLPKFVYQIIRLVFRSPDIYILLDISPETALKRIKNRKNLQSHETISALDRIRRNYLALSTYEAKNSKLYIINAEKSKNEVETCIKNILTS